MKKSSLVVFVIALMISACTDPKNGIKISGVYEEPKDSLLVKIELVMNNRLSVIDSFSLEPSGKFERWVKIPEQGFYRINFYDRHITNMILDSVDVQVTKDNLSPQESYVASGSKSTDFIYQLTSIKQKFDMESQALNSEFMNARNSGDMEVLEDIRFRFLKMKINNDKEIKQAIWNMDYSISGMLATSFLDEEKEFSFMDSLATKYKSQLPNSQYTEELIEKVESFRRLAIGSPAPEISLPNPDGELVTLSSFKGKYVMIDFWAAWCRPCRMENPNVVRLYNTYNTHGFEVLGVSLDRKKESWVRAISDDQLSWTHISDLKYFDSEAAHLYKINAIPATYLIDPNGIIIGKNLRGSELEAKLKEIFG